MVNFFKEHFLSNNASFQGLLQVFQHYIQCKCSQMSASLTYTTLLSIVPIVTVLLVILSSVPMLEPVREQVYNQLYTNLMPESGLQLKEYLNKFTQHFGNLTIMGIVALLVTTMITLFKIELSFNYIWQINTFSNINNNPEYSSTHNILRYIARTLVRYLFIIILVPIILGTAFLATGAIQGAHLLGQLDFASIGINTNQTGQETWTKYLPYLSSVGTQLWARLLSFAITAIGFSAMYWFIPKDKVPAKSAFFAGIIIAILFEVLKFTFGWIIGRFTSYASIYGAFAVLPILIIWINLSWHLILLGVVISYHKSTGKLS